MTDNQFEKELESGQFSEEEKQALAKKTSDFVLSNPVIAFLPLITSFLVKEGRKKMIK